MKNKGYPLSSPIKVQSFARSDCSNFFYMNGDVREKFRHLIYKKRGKIAEKIETIKISKIIYTRGNEDVIMLKNVTKFITSSDNYSSRYPASSQCSALNHS